MKRILAFILTIIIVTFIFSGCKNPPIDTYDDFDFLDTVIIAVGDTLYENENYWVTVDSIIEDSRCLSGVDCVTAGRAIVRFTMPTLSFYNGGVMTIDVATDTLSERYIYLPLLEGSTEGEFKLLDVLPYPVQGEVILQKDYMVKILIDHTVIIDRKPNLYLYPEKKTKMTVSMDFPHGGEVVESDPAYPNEWKNIKVKPNGKINKKHDYLYYECEIPDIWQYSEGWVVKQEELTEFFTQNLNDYGFNEAEIEDFIEFWIPKLIHAPNYKIFPQYTEMVNRVIKLWISPRPESLMRLHYVIVPSDDVSDLPVPEIPKYEPQGFTAREWGVILK